MPDRLTVGFWNLQNFGTENARSPFVRGVASAEGAGIIAALVGELNIDILMVMEVMSTGQNSLNSLRDALNDRLMDPHWCYDWIPSAYGVGGQATRNDQLSYFTGGSRSEGYAVFWKSGDPRYTMVPAYYPVSNGASKDEDNKAVIPAHCLALVDEGRLLGPAAGGGISLFTGYNPNVDRLLTFDENRQLRGWAPLPFVSAGKGESVVPRTAFCRRPAYCVISLNDNALLLQDQQIPIIAYHAPSYRPRASTGTWISGLGRQLAVTRMLDGSGSPKQDDWIRCNKVIAAGDYNIQYDQPNAMSYASYWYPYTEVAWETGSSCSYMTPVPTTVQLNEFSAGNGRYSGDPIISGNAADYYHAPIDNLFCRGLTHCGAGRPDLITMLMSSNYLRVKAIDRVLQAAVAQQGAVTTSDGHPYTHVDVYGRPILTYPGISHFNNFRKQINSGTFSHARQAAEFLRIFVSDHLPVLVSFEV